MNTLLEFLAHQSPFYRKLKLFDASLEDFPVLTRSLLRENYRDLLTVAGEQKEVILHGLVNGPADPRLRGSSEFACGKGTVVEQTSGSSGTPLRMVKDAAERSVLGMAAWRRRVSRDPSIRTETFVPIFHRALDTALPVSPYSSSPAGVRAFYDWAATAKVRWLHAPAPLMEYHCNMLKSLGLTKAVDTLRYVELSGSNPSRESIELIEDVLGAIAINQYGTRETWAIGYAEGLRPFSVNSEAIHVEILDDGDKPITEMGVEGYVTLTSKVLKLLPVVRYKTGDRGYWSQREANGFPASGPMLSLSPERDINMLQYNGSRVSGNILFKEVLHKIDHRIGYGYTEFMQIRKLSATDWKLIVFNCEALGAVHQELERFLRTWNPRFQLQTEIVSSYESRRLAERKPYLFVNECPAESARN